MARRRSTWINGKASSVRRNESNLTNRIDKASFILGALSLAVIGGLYQVISVAPLFSHHDANLGHHAAPHFLPVLEEAIHYLANISNTRSSGMAVFRNESNATHRSANLTKQSTTKVYLSTKTDVPQDDPREQFGVPAYVASVILCKFKASRGKSIVGFIDAATVLRHSIHRNSKHYHHNSSTTTPAGKYGYKMYAIVHTQCRQYAPLLEKLGYETLIRPSPVLNQDIQGEWYRNHVEREACCGSAEFIKLYSYTLLQHPVVVHLDLDKIFLKPLDDLFDAMLFDSKSLLGMAARQRLDLEFPMDPLPTQIDAYFTRDYTSMWPWKKVAGVQAGLFVLRPSLPAFAQFVDIIREGNYTFGSNDSSGWGSLGFGGFCGAMAMQGILPYYYDHLHPHTAVELNVCTYNQVAADVKWRGRGGRGKNNIGQCNRYPKYDHNFEKNVDCEDCRVTDVERVYTVHYTACKKPWTCPIGRSDNKDRNQRHRISTELTNVDTCWKLHREWYKLRWELDQAMVRSVAGAKERRAFEQVVQEQRNGTFMKDVFFGYCAGEGGYRPMVWPEGEEWTMEKVYETSVGPVAQGKEVVATPSVDRAMAEKKTFSISVSLSPAALKVQQQMQAFIPTLPSPKWPQLDHGTAEAVARDGIILLPENAMLDEGQHKSTIVTAYYEFTSKHSPSRYQAWFQRLLQASDPMIIFVEPQSSWLDMVLQQRQQVLQHGSSKKDSTAGWTIVVPRKFEDLVMSTTFAERFWEDQHEIDPEKALHKGTGVYKIWNEKLVLMHACSQLNPFQTPTFTWMDAGYFRRQHQTKPYQQIINTDITKAGVPPTKMLLLHILDPEVHHDGTVATAGNVFVGTAHAVHTFYEAYYHTLWNMVKRGEFVGSDQKVATQLCLHDDASVCHLHFPGRFKHWHAMIYILRDAKVDLSKKSTMVAVTNQSVTPMVPVPTGQKILRQPNRVDLRGVF